MKKHKFSMKSLAAILSVITVSSVVFLACNKSEVTSTSPIKQPEPVQALLGGFTHKYISLNGGNKGDCSEPGQNCKGKSAGSSFTSEEQAELLVLTGCVTNNNTLEYFTIGHPNVLFPELEAHDINQILDGTLFFYQTENNAAPNSSIYVLSNSPTRDGIATENTLAAWVY